MGHMLLETHSARRTTRWIVLIAIVGGGWLSTTAAGAQDRDAPKIVRMQTLNVRDILYILTGGGGNTLALMRDDGVVLIDTKLPGWGRSIRGHNRGGHRQAGDDDHQHACARRPYRRQRRLRHGSADHCPRKHQGEHAEDGRLQGSEREISAQHDRDRSAVAARRYRSHRLVLFRTRSHGRRPRRRVSRRSAWRTSATCFRPRQRRSSIPPTAAAAWNSQRRSREWSPRSKA